MVVAAQQLIVEQKVTPAGGVPYDHMHMSRW